MFTKRKEIGVVSLRDVVGNMLRMILIPLPIFISLLSSLSSLIHAKLVCV